MIVHVVASLGLSNQGELPLACGSCSCSCSFPRTGIREASWLHRRLAEVHVAKYLGTVASASQDADVGGVKTDEKTLRRQSEVGSHESLPYTPSPRVRL